MFEVRVVERFVAQHRLRYPDGQWELLHEHDWGVTVAIGGSTLNGMDVLVDFVPVRAALRTAIDAWRGRSLNDAAEFEGVNPSAERVAMHLAERLRPQVDTRARLLWVDVEEEAGCFARYSPPPDFTP